MFMEALSSGSILVFFLITGSVNGFRPNEQYVYAYEGVIFTGQPTLNDQAAGAGLKCGVIVQAVSNGTLIVKMSDVMVGDFNKNQNYWGRTGPINITYDPIANTWAVIEKPFVVSLNEKDFVMTTPAEEPTWVTNVRKSILQHFLIDPLKKKTQPNIGGSRSTFLEGNLRNTSYSVDEESILGNCSSHYSYQRMSSTHSMARFEGRGVEGSPTTPPADMWRVVKSINLDQCSDRVVLQKSTLGSFPDVGTAWESPMQMRVSQSESILEAKEGSLVLGGVNATGELISNLNGVGNAQIHTRTIQTLRLTSSGEMNSTFKVSLPQQVVKTLCHEIVSPFQPSNTRPKPSWIKFENKTDLLIPFSLESLGMSESPSFGQSRVMKIRFLNFLEEVKSVLLVMPSMPQREIKISTARANVLARLSDMTDIMENLLPQEVTAIFDQVFPSQRRQSTKLNLKQDLLIDVASASGSAAAIRQLLKLVKRGRLSDEKLATIFLTMTNHISSPFVTSEIIDLFNGISMAEKPILKSMSAINLGSTIRRLCLPGNSILHQIFGRFTCTSETLKKYVDEVYKGVMWSEKVEQKIVWLEALINLGPPFSTQMFLYALSDPPAFANPLLKLAVVRGLRHHRNDISDMYMAEFLKFFNHLIVDEKEDIRVRQASILTIISWHQDSSFWHRMALQTYKMNPEMAAFIYFTMKDLAELTNPDLRDQVAMVQEALLFCKKFAPNYRYPLQYFSDVILPIEQFEVKKGIRWLPDPLKEIIAYLSTNLGGKIENLFKFRWEENEKGSFSEGFPEREEKLGALVFKLWKNIEAFLPVSRFTLANSIGVGGNKLLRALRQERQEFQFVKFFRANSRKVLLPSEVGLPIVAKIVVPALFSNEGEVKLNKPDIDDVSFQNLWDSLVVDLAYKLNSRLAFKTNSRVDVMIPWSGVVASSGIDSLKEVNLPIQGHLGQTLNDMGNHNLTFTTAPLFRPKFPVFYIHNLPYTSLIYLWPLNAIGDLKSFKFVSLSPDQSPIYKENFTLRSSMDFKMDFSWKADQQHRFSRGYVIESIKNPSKLLDLLLRPGERLLQAFVAFDTEKSPNKNFTLALTPGVFYRCGTDESVNVQVEKSLETGSVIPLRMHQGLENRHVKYTTVNILFEFFSHGPTHHRRSLETAIVFEGGRNFTKKHTSGGVAFRRVKTDSYGVVEMDTSCLLIDIAAYSVQSVSDLTKLLSEKGRARKDIDIEYISRGTGCLDERPALRLQAEMSLSELRRLRLLAELNQTRWRDVDPLDPTISFLVDAVYDLGKIISYGKRRNVSQGELQVFSFFSDVLRSVFESNVETVYWAETNPTPLISMTLDRVLGLDEWNIEGSIPGYAMSWRNVHLPRFLDQMVSPIGFESPPTHLRDHIACGESAVETCALTEKEITEKKMEAFYYFSNFLEFIFEPQKEITYLQERDSSGKISMAFERNLVKDEWGLAVALPDRKVSFHGLKLPGFADQILSPWARRQLLTEPHFQYSSCRKRKVENCTITADKFVTFNGNGFNWTLTNCYTVASKPKSSSIYHKPQWLIMIQHRGRDSHKLEIRIKNSEGLSLDINSDEVKMNGQTIIFIEDFIRILYNSGKLFCTVTKRSDSFDTTLFNGVRIVVSPDRVQIQMDSRFSTPINGLCSQLGKRSRYVGPKGCLYSGQDMVYYSYAWTIAGGEGCDLDTYFRHYLDVVDFQSRCTKTATKGVN